MDIGLTIGPIGGAVQAAGFAGPNPTPVPQAVATELPSSQAVTAAATVAPTRNDSTPPATAPPTTTVDIEIDKKNNEVVYRVVDKQTGHVILEIPQVSSTDLTV